MMSAVTALTDRFDRALLYPTHVHGGQVRKETTIPYVAHLLAVAATVLEYRGSEDMAIAGLLHDAAEDQGGEARLADIRHRFGDRVADIVHACSDSVANTAAGQQKEDWRTRKTRYIEHLKTVDRETCLVSLSDKVHNARSILRDLANRKSVLLYGADSATGPRKTLSGITASWQVPFKACCPASSRMS